MVFDFIIYFVMSRECFRYLFKICLCGFLFSCIIFYVSMNRLSLNCERNCK